MFFRGGMRRSYRLTRLGRHRCLRTHHSIHRRRGQLRRLRSIRAFLWHKNLHLSPGCPRTHRQDLRHHRCHHPSLLSHRSNRLNRSQESCLRKPNWSVLRNRNLLQKWGCWHPVGQGGHRCHHLCPHQRLCTHLRHGLSRNPKPNS